MEAEILGLLPTLRRYALCVTGSLQKGDDWIEQTLKHVFNFKDLMDGEPLKIALFKALHRTPLSERGLPNHEETRVVKTEKSVLDLRFAAHVLRLPLLNRQVLLLVYTMEFTDKDAAEILGLLPVDIKKLRQSARSELVRMSRSA